VQITLVERTLTELDHVRLLNLLRRSAPSDRAAPHPIDDVLDGCTLVPSREISPDIVTMRSQVTLQDLRTGQRSTLTLCYPGQADPAAGLVSVLSPLGSALIGLRVGSVARWSSPAGDRQDSAAEIVTVLFQPEANGDYTV
jgi:regulator of nucleoside diphosphate kinase